jgi:probable HAF family extracellular repeat protein
MAAALAMMTLTVSPAVSEPALAQTAGPRYTLTRLPPLSNFSQSGAFGINRAGHVAGWAIPSDGSNKAARWANGAATNLGFLVLPGDFFPYHSSMGLTVNDADEVAGWTSLNLYHRAVVFRNGSITDLGTLPGLPSSEARSMNNQGQIVGFSSQSAGGGTGDRAVLWQNGTMVNLGTLGGNFSQAYHVNNAGQVVGQSGTTGDTASHAFLWRNGVMQDLGVLGSGQISAGFGVNESGQVVGVSTTVPGSFAMRHPILYSGGRMIDLGLPGTNTELFAVAINASGVIVGYNDTPHAFIYRDGGWTDLNTLIPHQADGLVLATATDINDAGQIVGVADQGGGQLAYILTPVVN